MRLLAEQIDSGHDVIVDLDEMKGKVKVTVRRADAQPGVAERTIPAMSWPIFGRPLHVRLRKTIIALVAEVDQPAKPDSLNDWFREEARRAIFESGRTYESPYGTYQEPPLVARVPTDPPSE